MVRILSAALLCLILLFLAGSLILQRQKRETCPTAADVWRDIGHLLSQKGSEQLGHRLSSLRIYLSSNLLDGVLYEWRWLDEQGMLPEDPDSCYVGWGTSEADEAAPGQEGSYAVPTMLMVWSEETVFHNNPHTLDYTKQINTVDIDGRAVYSYEDGSLSWAGYTSQITFSSYVTEAGTGTETEKKTVQGALFDSVAGSAWIPSDAALWVPRQGTLFFDPGAPYSQPGPTEG